MNERVKLIPASELHQTLIEIYCCESGNDNRVPPTRVSFCNPKNWVVEFKAVLSGVNAVDLLFSGSDGQPGAKYAGGMQTNNEGWIVMKMKDYQKLVTPQEN